MSEKTPTIELWVQYLVSYPAERDVVIGQVVTADQSLNT